MFDTGFQNGWVQFDNVYPSEGPTSAQFEGAVPDGEYRENTKLYFCCRQDGDPGQPVDLPNTQALALFPFSGDCQKVVGELLSSPSLATVRRWSVSYCLPTFFIVWKVISTCEVRWCQLLTIPLFPVSISSRGIPNTPGFQFPLWHIYLHTVNISHVCKSKCVLNKKQRKTK